jgi:hypothetical protein
LLTEQQTLRTWVRAAESDLHGTARLLAVETVDVETVDASETRASEDANESSDDLRMRSHLFSSSCVPNVVMLSNEAINVAALPFPPNVSIVPIDVFKPVE